MYKNLFLIGKYKIRYKWCRCGWDWLIFKGTLHNEHSKLTAVPPLPTGGGGFYWKFTSGTLSKFARTDTNIIPIGKYLRVLYMKDKEILVCISALSTGIFVKINVRDNICIRYKYGKNGCDPSATKGVYTNNNAHFEIHLGSHYRYTPEHSHLSNGKHRLQQTLVSINT